MVIAPGGGDGRKSNTESTLNSTPMAQSLTSTDLSNIESGGPQAANNTVTL